MKVQDIILMREIINDRTDIVIYEDIYGDYDDFSACLDDSPLKCIGEWFRDQILDYAGRTVKYFEYYPERNKCKITVKKERED